MTSADKKGFAMTRFVFCALLLLLFFINSDTALAEMKRGLALCGEVLVPTLFPYMAVSELLVRSELGIYAERLFGRPMKRLFGVSGACAGALALGLLCGFPVGAKTAFGLYERGEISRSDCEALMAFCNFPSAPFMIVAVGERLFSSRRAGVFFYLTVIAGGLLYGILHRAAPLSEKRGVTFGERGEGKISFAEAFTDSVVSAAGSVITVCAYVCFFTCAVGVLASMLGNAFRPIPRALLFSFFELTSGAAACAAVDPVRLGGLLTAAAAGWGGLSVLLQIYSLSRTKGERVSLRPYILSKAFSSVFCAALTAAALHFFPSLMLAEAPLGEASVPAVYLPSGLAAAADLLFILSLLLYLYKKLDRRRAI